MNVSRKEKKMHRYAIVATLMIVSVGMLLAGQEQPPVLFYEGCSFWSADAEFVGLSTGSVHHGDAGTTGLVLGLAWPQGYWMECDFSSGREDFPTAADTYNVRKATGIVGIASKHLDLGVGLNWEGRRWCSSSNSVWSPLGVARLRYPLTEAGLEGCLSVILCPLCGGGSLERWEYSEARLSAKYMDGAVFIEVGYRYRSHYRLPTDLSYRGFFLSLGLGLGLGD
jgi:hypothetical protein